MQENGRKRVVIEDLSPEIDGGRFAAKGVAGERLVVSADIFSDGHDAVAALLLFRGPGDADWRRKAMEPMANDRWGADFTPDTVGIWSYTVEGFVDHFLTWKKDLRKKREAGVDTVLDRQIGAAMIEEAADRSGQDGGVRLRDHARRLRAAGGDDAVPLAWHEELAALMSAAFDRDLVSAYGKVLKFIVDPPLAGFSAWYERFPRSCAAGDNPHGTLADCEALLPEVARLGFDVFYLPPIHPIGSTSRKGRNNNPAATEGDVGSPWAIGSAAGGHDAIHPELGTIADFERLVARARELGIAVALDLAFQCSPDHPWVSEHPEWFRRRPDGSIQYAENPPKKYEDIYPLNFESENWRALWGALRDVVLFWIGKGVSVFRVDNPHTKSFPFWEWLIGTVKSEHPEVLFLAEAFTRPKVMKRLAKLGFSQSYTYFTWRNTKDEITEYLGELTDEETAAYFRPNFWPNTPDILPDFLQWGGRPAFVSRLILAATLSSNYGIYGPAFELMVGDALPGREEYLDSEKFETRRWDWNSSGNLKGLISRVNSVRRENPALQRTANLRFLEVDNEALLFYAKVAEELDNVILVLVSLDPHHRQTGWVQVPLELVGISGDRPYLVHDLLSDDRFIWTGDRNYVEIRPEILSARILRLHRRLKREADFDYFM